MSCGTNFLEAGQMAGIDEAEGEKNPNVHLEASFDKFVGEKDGYKVTKSVFGKDASGTYDMIEYVFEPSHYTKTIQLTGCLHGTEYTGFYFLTQFFDLLMNHWKDFKQFQHLRECVRFVVVPIVNMWGFANKKRQNETGVDLNRNFDYNWQQYDQDQPGQTFYKGEAPFSEPETRAMRDFFNRYQEAVAHIDFHTIGSLGHVNYVLFYPREKMNDISPGIDTINYLMRGEQTQVTASSILPSMTNYNCRNHKINALLAEYANGTYSNRYDSEEMTQVMRWFGNLVIRSSRLNKPQVTILKQPFVDWRVFSEQQGNTPIRILRNRDDHDEYSDVGPIRVLYEIANNGFLTLDGYVKISVEDAESEVRLLPLLYQRYAPEFSWGKMKGNEMFAIRAHYGVGEHVIPIHAAIPVQKSVSELEGMDGNDYGTQRQRTREAVFRLMANRQNISSLVWVTEMRAKVTFMPTAGLAQYSCNC